MPDARRVNGRVTGTKPFACGGVLISDFQLVFRNGSVVDATAGHGEAALRALLATDEGASRLGEVALVPHSSPVSKYPHLFLNSLLDENAACHLALGQSLRFCVENGNARDETAFKETGGNSSVVHEDFMIGSGRMDVDGMTRDNQAEAIMRSGEWVI